MYFQSFYWREYIRNALFYLAPFFAFLLFDIFFVRHSFFLYPTDGIPGFFGMGLNWLALRPLVVFHQPAYFFQQISALLIATTGTQGESLFPFAIANMTVNVLFLIISGIWMGYVSKKIEIKGLHLLALGAITITMPAMMITMPVYFAAFSLLTPLILAIYYFCSQEKNTFALIFTTLAVLGFIVANFVITVVFLIAVLLYILFIFLKNDDTSLQQWLGLHDLKYQKILYGVTILLLPLLLLSLALPLFFPRGGISRGSPLIFITMGASILVLTFLIVNIARRTKKVKKFSLSVFLPLLVGWTVGNNIMAPFWGLSVWYSWITKGATIPLNIPVVANDTPLQIIEVFLSSIWNILLVISLTIGCIALVHYLKKREKTSLFISIFVLTTIILNVALVAPVIFYPIDPQWSNNSNFGLLSRYLLQTLAPVVISFVWLTKKVKNTTGIIIALALLVLSFLSFQEYQTRLGPVISTTSAANQQIKDIANNFLKENPGNRVICARTILPDFCSVLSGFNNYRNQSSSVRINKETLREGRIVYLKSFDDCKTSLKNCLQEKISDARNFLIIADKEDQQWLEEASILWQNPAIKTFVGILP